MKFDFKDANAIDIQQNKHQATNSNLILDARDFVSHFDLNWSQNMKSQEIVTCPVFDLWHVPISFFRSRDCQCDFTEMF